MNDGTAGSSQLRGTAAQLVDATTRLIGFRRHLRAEVVPGEAVYLFSERGVTALAGQHIEALAPLLDGTRDRSAVLRDMWPGTPPGLVEDLIAQLTAAGLVTTWPQRLSESDQQALAYWDASGCDPAAAVTDVSGSRLALITLGGVDESAAAAALGAAGPDVTIGPDVTADLTVVLCTDYLDPALSEIDAAARACGRPWLLAKPLGATVWIGPVFQPPDHGCWHCLAVRLMGHRQAEEYVQRALGRCGPAPRSAASIPPLAGMAMHAIGLEAVKWLAGYRYQGQHSVWTFDSYDLHGRHHELRARPQCAACGDPTMMSAHARRPLRLRQRLKTSYLGGGHRSMPPQQVLDHYRHLISPVTGVVKQIDRDPRAPEFFNAFRSGPNLAAGVRSLHGLKSALRVENGGKGATALDAEVSALCEALERHCGYFHGDEERVSGSLHSLGEVAIDPNDCQLFHQRQYEHRTEWNAAHSPFQYVCAPFDEHATVDWSPVWSLTEQRNRFLPTNLLYFGAPVEPGPLYVRADSNGNAAGCSLEDAVLQGLLELVERDAVALWWYNRTRAPQVDVDAFGDPWTDDLRDVYAGLGREVWVLDVTSDLQVPTMVALSRQVDGPAERIMFGFGAHLDPAVALRRALTEMNQLMPALLEVDQNGRSAWDDDPDAAYWLRHANVADLPYLLPDPATPARRPGGYGYVRRNDLSEDVNTIRTRLDELGMQLLVLDQSRPDIGLPVVKVIVPGLRHFWARFAPGRLYGAPVRLGRLAEPTPYDKLNPIPLFV